MVEMILISSVLLLLFICLRRILDGKIPAGLQYGLWFFVALRLLLVWVPLPGSSFSVMNLLPVVQDSYLAGDETEQADGNAVQEDIALSQENGKVSLDGNGQSQDAAASQGNGGQSQDGVALPENASESQTGNGQLQAGTALQGNSEQSQDGTTSQAAKNIFLLHSIIVWVYRLGIAAMLLWMTVKNLRLWLGLRRRRILYEGELPVATLPGKLYMVEHLDVPFLFGRNIYISPEMFHDQQKLRHILVHETCHWKQGDPVWSVLRCLCMALYWYHPLVWYGAHLSVVDAEMACDARAIRIMGEESRHGYGETLLDLIRNQSGLLECIGMSTQMSGNKRETKIRLERIVKQGKRNWGRILFLAVSMAVLCLITLPESGERENLAKDARWERVKQEGFPCILLDEEGNITGTIRGELLERVVFDYVTANMESESYQIKAGAFSDCRNLKTLVLPWQGESYEPYAINYIDENAFQGCPEDMVVYCKENSYAWNRLKELGIRVQEAGVEEEEEWRSSAGDANALKKIQEKIDSEGNNASLSDREMRQFYGEPFYMMTESGKIVSAVCNSLEEWAGDRQIYLPEEADSMDGTFANYTMTDTSITIPKNMTEIGDMTFMCAEFSEIIFEERSKLQSIGSRAFEQRTNIKELHLPEGLYHIGEAAFWCCPALKELTIPESVQSVGNSCFLACTALERVTVLNPDITFGEDAFPFEIINPELSDDEIDLDNPDANYIPNDRLVIVCHKGSNAEKYAQEHGARVEYLE